MGCMLGTVRGVSCSDVDSGKGPSAAAAAAVNPDDLSLTLAASDLYAFTYAEMKSATKNFSLSCLIGRGGFGSVYKAFIDGNLRPGIEPQFVAVKNLDSDGAQGHREWLAEVVYLGQLRHLNLVKLVGYCIEEEHRMLVYEYMPGGSLEDHLFKMRVECLPWTTRLKIAVGAAKGLAFLHDAKVIYRDFKASNILLDEDYTVKLSDFGLAKDGPQGDATHVSTRIMGTHGYAAPEYILTGHLTAKSDVYSFGVVLLELLTGRQSVDKTRPAREQNLVDWARPYLRKPEKLYKFMDARLEYSTRGASKAAQVAYQCLSAAPKSRPCIRNVVEALEPLLQVEDGLFTFTGTFVFTVTVRDDEKSGGAAEGERPPGLRQRHQISAIHAKSTLYSSRVRGHRSPDGSPGDRGT